MEIYIVLLIIYLAVGAHIVQHQPDAVAAEFSPRANLAICLLMLVLWFPLLVLMYATERGSPPRMVEKTYREATG